ncbi:nucleoside monophosphate kinase [Candidatus Peregrinibacteria bacterium]|nr:nucleoside monophosphate kinase [Candidatus Peregrinibacteria bacterium]
MDLVLFGIQGSGKGTQAKRLAAEFGYDIFEAGGELRKMAAGPTDLGKTVKSYIDEGHLVPFAIIMKVVEEAIAARKKDQKILFDGIPRDSDQRHAFDAIMQRQGRDFRCIQILLDIDEAMERIAGRAQSEGRADDADREKVRRRMDLFREKTMPVIEGYVTHGKVAKIDGKGDLDQVYERIRAAVSGF